jgi:hypothetical protein
VLAVAGINHRGEVQLSPAIATLEIGRHLMSMAVEAGQGAEIDHGAGLEVAQVKK